VFEVVEVFQVVEALPQNMPGRIEEKLFINWGLKKVSQGSSVIMSNWLQVGWPMNWASIPERGNRFFSFP
jgi:hypothetical protein